MKKLAIISTIFALTLWLLSVMIFLNFLPLSVLELIKPKTTAELGDSMGLLNGLLSSIAIVLALLTVYFQSKELKDSTMAQSEQAAALKQQLQHQRQMSASQLAQSQAIVKQLEQQQVSNRIVGLSARQKFLLSEISRLDLVIKDIFGNRDKEDLFNNCNAKKKRYQEEANSIDEQIKKILENSQ